MYKAHGHALMTSIWISILLDFEQRIQHTVGVGEIRWYSANKLSFYELKNMILDWI